MHHDKGEAQAERQRDNRYQRRAHVPQEQGADRGDDDKLFQQLVAEVVDGAVDKLAAVVGGDHFNPFRQAALQRRQLRFDRRITSRAFLPERRITTPPATSPSPLSSAIPRRISGPICTRATSPR